MRVNADFSQIAVVVPSDDAWVRSPESGVDRLMLDRVGHEVARATSVVRYAPGSSFPRHEHAKGEEFLVLAGVFSDEHGDYPTGCYVRNPPGSGHAPFSEEGCRILVKLRQFDDRDLRPVVVSTADKETWQNSGDRLSLHEFGQERVSMQRIAAGLKWTVGDPGGAELFVVSGHMAFSGEQLTAESWLRVPPANSLDLQALADSIVYLKTGHLAQLL